MARISPLPPKEWPPEMREAFAALRPPNTTQPALRTEGRPKALNALGTLAHHPELAQRLQHLQRPHPLHLDPVGSPA